MPNNRKVLQEKFEVEYQKLNENQRKAVDTIEGPVMVIAGPGTGKTQILASRIGKILLETDAQPSNILCLTHTDAGVVAMRKRLLQFIGPDAYKVGIYTFHAFCNEIIQENLPYFKKNELNPITELESVALLTILIDTLPKNNPLKRYTGKVYWEIKSLKKLFNVMKTEGWTSEFLNQKIDEYLSDIPTRDEYIYQKKYREFQKGDLRKNKLDAEVEKMEKLRAAVNEFPRYQELMNQAGLYDFADMINWVIQALTENPLLLSSYQEKYQYILVDEYQDTSGTQNKLVELLINYWDQPNIFVVGDDDQSIFRFQGANVYNMEKFANSFGGALEKVVLSNNYRSTQPILDISKGLIEKNKERLVTSLPGLTKELISANEDLRLIEQQPVISQYKTPHEEMIGIVSAVQNLLQEGTRPGEIGIIYKENQYGTDLANYFYKLGIPVFSKREEDLFNIPLAKKIILIFRYLAAEHDIPFSGDELLFEILHFNNFKIKPIEIAKICIEANNRSIESREKISIRELIIQKAGAPARDLFSISVDPSLKSASDIMEELISDVSNKPLLHLLESIIQKTGILSDIMKSTDKHFELLTLTTLFHFVRTETQRNPELQLDELVKILDLMKKEKLRIPLVRVSGDEKSVNLMTVHGSKGLEFENVFFAGCNSSTWEKKNNKHKGYRLPDTVFSNMDATDEEELRRLFYVALTRARKNLQISYALYSNDVKKLEPSMFIAEIQEFSRLKINEINFSDKTLEEFATLMYNKELAPEIEKIEYDFVNRLLGKFVMNSTALNNFLSCPLNFYFNSLIHIPSAKNENMEFGSAVHYALEQLFRKMLKRKDDPKYITSGESAFPSAEEFIGDFEWFMKRHRESFTKEQFNRRMEYGQEVLHNYYQKYIHSFHTIVAIEQNIKNVVIDQVPIKGKLDKLEFYGKKVKVVDYKTGNPEYAKDKLKGPNDKQPNGGNYWRQAIFYKLLVDHFPNKEWVVEQAEFDFVEPDQKREYVKMPVRITPADIQTVRQQITSSWEKIQAHDFYTGCGKSDCHWCNFVKDHNLAIALHETVAGEGGGEEEDDSFQN